MPFFVGPLPGWRPAVRCARLPNRSARAVRSLNFQNKMRLSDCCRAANRGEPDRGLNAGGVGSSCGWPVPSSGGPRPCRRGREATGAGNLACSRDCRTNPSTQCSLLLSLSFGNGEKLRLPVLRGPEMSSAASVVVGLGPSWPVPKT